MDPLSKFPPLGLGTHQLDIENVQTMLDKALANGICLLDCAFLYKNEAIIGNCLQELMRMDKIEREKIFISGKLPMNGMANERVFHFLHKSLSSLQTNYLDLYLIHAPFSVKYVSDEIFYPVNQQTSLLDADSQSDYRDTWKQLEKLVRQEFVKYIGLSNFNINQVRDILDCCQIKPTVLQVEIHAYLQQKSLRKFCDEEDIIIEAFAPLASPKKAKKILINDKNIKQIAKKYNKSCAQILLRWIQQNRMIPIVSVDNLDQLSDLFGLNDFSLSDEDHHIIESLDCNERVYYFDSVPGTRQHPKYPFNEE